jgi:hypothetical protein
VEPRPLRHPRSEPRPLLSSEPFVLGRHRVDVGRRALVEGLGLPSNLLLRRVCLSRRHIRRHGASDRRYSGSKYSCESDSTVHTLCHGGETTAAGCLWPPRDLWLIGADPDSKHVRSATGPTSRCKSPSRDSTTPVVTPVSPASFPQPVNSWQIEFGSICLPAPVNATTSSLPVPGSHVPLPAPNSSNSTGRASVAPFNSNVT